jgi:stage II sporulation SpoE-like protein
MIACGSSVLICAVGLEEGVLFYTDGLIEAHNPQGEMFGTPRLRSLLSERSQDARGLSTTLLEELYSHLDLRLLPSMAEKRTRGALSVRTV